MTATQSAFIQNLRYFMALRGLNQRALARKSRGKLTQANISHTLSGKTCPSLHTVAILADLLEAEPWKMLMPVKRPQMKKSP